MMIYFLISHNWWARGLPRERTVPWETRGSTLATAAVEAYWGEGWWTK